MAKTGSSKTKPDSGTTAMLGALQATNPAATRAWFDLLAESSRFAMSRLQQDLDAQRALMTCKTPTEVMQVQTEYLQDAMQQYSEEARRLWEMMASATRDTVAVTGAGTARSYDDVPL